MTLAQAKADLAKIGITIRKRDNEYRVNFKGGSEESAYYTTDLDDAVGTGHAMVRIKESQRIWIWNWIGGGYNWCKAANREEAFQKATEMAARTILKVDETTLREGDMSQVGDLDRQYASLFY